MANHTKKGTFVPGDARINRNGRPRSFDGLRRLAQEIAGRKVSGLATLSFTPGAADFTNAEDILHDWATSSDFQKQRAFLQIAYGSPPDGPAIETPEETSDTGAA